MLKEYYKKYSPKIFSPYILKLIAIIIIILGIFILLICGYLSIEGTGLPQNPLAGVQMITAAYVILYMIVLPILTY
jgi:hypothetical protein